MKRWLFCCVLATVTLAFSADKPANVVLITIDTLRADYVSRYGSRQVQTPALDALADDGAWFETAYCQAPMTPPSHASILTGTYPATHGLRDFTSGRLRPGSTTLATLLKQRGYQTAAFVSAFMLDSKWGLDQGFDLYNDDFQLQDFQGVSSGNIQRRADETVGRVLQWLPQAKAPFFLWVHLFDPHHDYNPPPAFKRRYPANLYAGEVAYTDSEIARLVAALKRAGHYTNTVIVATSDHGESLGEHREPEHGFFVYDATVRIPLILKMPAGFQVRGRKVSTIAQSVDILPTVLQILRAPSPKMEGRGLLASILGKAGASDFAYAETLYPRTTFGWSELKAYREGRYKFIDAPKAELYDLAQDPGETRNLYSANQSLAHQFQQKLRRLEQGFAAASSRGDGGAIDPETLARLAALGYIAVTQPTAASSRAGLQDPKDTVDVFGRILEALQAAEAGRPGASNALLQQVAAKEPALFIVQYQIGVNYLKLGQHEKALEALGQAGRLNPGFELVEVQSARALAALGRAGEGIERLRVVVARNPGLVSAQNQLALMLTRERRFGEAAEVYRAILKLRPDDRQAIKLLGIVLAESRNYAEGARLLAQAVALGIDDAMVRNSLGISLVNLGRVDEGIAAYRKALEFKADYAQARLNLSFALLRSGKKEEARREFQTLCQSNPALCKQYEEHFR
ncbi:MAG: sulfatase-like hydrolase/transferase [Acidobacteriota bacterium]